MKDKKNLIVSAITGVKKRNPKRSADKKSVSFAKPFRKA